MAYFIISILATAAGVRGIDVALANGKPLWLLGFVPLLALNWWICWQGLKLRGVRG